MQDEYVILDENFEDDKLRMLENWDDNSLKNQMNILILSDSGVHVTHNEWKVWKGKSLGTWCIFSSLIIWEEDKVDISHMYVLLSVSDTL